MVRNEQEAILEVQEWSGIPTKGPAVVGKPSRRSEVVGRPSRRSGSGLESHTEVREGTGGPPEGPGGDERPSCRSGSVREALREGREWSKDIAGGSIVVSNIQEAILEVWEWSGIPTKGPAVVGSPPGGPGVVERHSRRSGSGREALP